MPFSVPAVFAGSTNSAVVEKEALLSLPTSVVEQRANVKIRADFLAEAAYVPSASSKGSRRKKSLINAFGKLPNHRVSRKGKENRRKLVLSGGRLRR